MKYWLIKSEPDCYSIDQFAKDKKTLWSGVRNFQARNFLRDSMDVGDRVFFYHSGKDAGIVGLAQVGKTGTADITALDKKDDHYDPKSSKENPIWYAPEMVFVKKFKNPFSLKDIKFRSELADMPLVQTGNRLSVQPVSEKDFKRILELTQ